ncbi:hypothetical protein DL769_007561 [Monosporascus sp. CRB-8-3]|nr:hypothetical protein DL769_007561 [Monosporascus sp. CRB-8-3]
MAGPEDATADYNKHKTVSSNPEQLEDDTDGYYYVEEVDDDEVPADLVGEEEEAESGEEEEDNAEEDEDVEEYEVEDPKYEELDRPDIDGKRKRRGEGRGTKRRRSSASQAGGAYKKLRDGNGGAAKRGSKLGRLKSNTATAEQTTAS